MKVNSNQRVSVVLPCKNEAQNLRPLLPRIRATLPDAEILLVNDGSDDRSALVAQELGVKVVSHPYSMGNGAAIKTGVRHATGDVLVFMDADGQHDPAYIPHLLEKMDQGYEMVVGARDASSQASKTRRIGNGIYNRFASFMTGYKIKDLTSGFRAVRARHFRKFLYLLPNGFSYPTTSTMAFFRSGLPVFYLPITVSKREGQSHIKIVRDGLKFFIIILKVGTLFSPMRVFIPISGFLFLLGLGYYGYTFLSFHRFTNMSALLFISSLFTLLIGLVSEQISSLHYKGIDEDVRKVARIDS